ncbi:MAG TPA: CoA-binding protein, partial [Burkholderiales bacterium]|nr:CoA-binding protein [Burkholderiales bacterium]
MSSLPAPRPVAHPASDLTRFLAPRGVAVVGVSQETGRIGGQALKLLTDFGYTGKIYPVNPKYSEVRGITCYPDLASVPKPCDVALIALSAQHVISQIEQCGKAGIPYALVLAGGFSEVGDKGAALQSQLASAAREAGVRVVGPNCLGLMNLKDGARIGFGGTMQLTTLKPGPLAMVTQSGGFGFGVVAMACHFGLGFNYVVSTGNEADLTSVPQPCDVALIALSAQHVIPAIEQCGKAGIPYALVLAGGFSEVGDKGAALQSQLAAAAREAGV